MKTCGRDPHLLQVRDRETGQGSGLIHVGCNDCSLWQQPLNQNAQTSSVDQIAAG